MGQIEYVQPVDCGTLTGDPTQAAAIFAMSDTAAAVAREVVDNAGGTIALKLRQTGDFRFRSVMTVDPHTGVATVEWQVRLGSIKASDAIAAGTEVAQLVTAMDEALGSVDLPAGCSFDDPVLHVRTFG